MSDFKFECPNCGQHILCDTSNAGMQIPCPGCQNVLTVPTPAPAAPAAGPAKLGIRKTAAHQAPPPAAASAPAKPAWGAASAPTAGKRYSALAIASLICSLLCFIGWLPAIICGHLGRARIARDSSLKGKGLATAGLIIGYLWLVLIIGWYAIAAPYLRKQIEIAQQQQAEHEKQVLEQHRAAAEAAAKLKASKAAWTLDLAAAEFPQRHASGKLHAEDFRVEAVVFQSGTLTLRQDSGLSRQFVISVPLKPGESLSGKSFQIAPADPDPQPRIVLNWKDETGKRLGMQTFTKGYALKLEFGTLADGKLPGKIYLCLPDDEQSYVAGNFEIGPRTTVATPTATTSATTPDTMRGKKRRTMKAGLADS